MKNARSYKKGINQPISGHKLMYIYIYSVGLIAYHISVGRWYFGEYFHSSGRNYWVYHSHHQLRFNSALTDITVFTLLLFTVGLQMRRNSPMLRMFLVTILTKLDNCWLLSWVLRLSLSERRTAWDSGQLFYFFATSISPFPLLLLQLLRHFLLHQESSRVHPHHLHLLRLLPEPGILQ